MELTDFVYDGPFAKTGLTMDNVGSVEGAGGEDGAEFGVGPGDFSDGAFAPWRVAVWVYPFSETS